MPRAKNSELYAHVADLTGLNLHQSRIAFNAVFRAIAEELQVGNDVYISGFGTFRFSLRRAHDRVDNLYGKSLTFSNGRVITGGPTPIKHVPANYHLKFRVHPWLKEIVRGARVAPPSS